MALMSLSAFAKSQGWSRQYVSKLVKQGKITLVNGKVDRDKALAALQANAEPASALRKSSAGQTTMSMQSPTRPSDSRQAVDFVTARTMREAFRAKMAKLEYEQKAGKLTDAAKVRDDAFQAARMTRDALLGIPDRMADILAAEKDPGRVSELLREELENVLEQLVNMD